MIPSQLSQDISAISPHPAASANLANSSISPDEIRHWVETVLPAMEQPGRYIGGESNQVFKSAESVLAKMALVFPDVYELGMSHNGTKVLYHLLNRENDLAAERAFAPWPDFGEALKNNNIPLYSLESFTPISAFDAVGISLQTELNYTNVPYILDLAGITLLQADRRNDEAFVIGGGPCMANPEPVADFYDLFVIGDGEILAAQLLRMIGKGRQEGLSREEILAQMARLPGVYVPSLFPMQQNDRGEWVPEKVYSQGPYLRAQGVKRTWVEVLKREDYPVKNLVPNMNLVHDRYSIEVMRGCTQGCRFCQAGYWYRPNRELHPDAVVELAREGLAATGERELGLLSLSTADYSQVEKVTDWILQQPDFERVNISLPSLRANSFGQGLAQKISVLTGTRSATFAPETGSERLRKMINKTISDADMLEAAERVFSGGFQNIKLYTMVGLPTENQADMEAFCGLIEQLNSIGQKHNRRNTIHPNIGILVPKPFTPMQWCGFMPREKVEAHIQFVRNYFRRSKSVRITWSDWELAHVEAFYSRGDRSQSKMILEAYRRGMVFESFSEHFNYAKWKELWSDFGYNPERPYEERKVDEVFPWDFIHAGSNKGFLRNEYKKMLDEAAAPVADCKWGECLKCGIPGNGQDTSLAPDPVLHKAEALDVKQLKERAKERRIRSTTPQTYLLIYAKRGLSRFLSHHITMDQFERAFRRLKVGFQFSNGFSPKPIIKNAGALPVGLESACEPLVVELVETLTGNLEDWKQKISDMLPKGMEILSIRHMSSKRFPILKSIDFSLSPELELKHELKLDADLESKSEIPVSVQEAGEVGEEKNPELRALQRIENRELEPLILRDRKIDPNEEILKAWVDERGLMLRVRTNPSGGAVNPFAIFAACMNTTVDSIKMRRVCKEAMEMELQVGLDLGLELDSDSNLDSKSDSDSDSDSEKL